MMAAFAGAFFATGLLVLLHGLFPQKADLGTRLGEFSSESGLSVPGSSSSLFDSYALTLLVAVKGEKLVPYEADVLVTGSDLQATANDKAKGGAGGAGLLTAMGLLFGWVSSPVSALVVVAVGATVGYALPDMELKKKAASRRVEFSRTLTAFMTLLSASISGGGGLTTALDDASVMGDGWVFNHITECLAEARLDGTSAWVALERLGHKLQVIPLMELAGSLTLAGTSGARVTDTLVARAQSSREKELADVRSEAEAKSSQLGVPVGLMMMSWVCFIGYPAIQNLLGGL